MSPCVSLTHARKRLQGQRRHIGVRPPYPEHTVMLTLNRTCCYNFCSAAAAASAAAVAAAAVAVIPTPAAVQTYYHLTQRHDRQSIYYIQWTAWVLAAYYSDNMRSLYILRYMCWICFYRRQVFNVRQRQHEMAKARGGVIYPDNVLNTHRSTCKWNRIRSGGRLCRYCYIGRYILKHMQYSFNALFKNKKAQFIFFRNTSLASLNV